MPVLSVRTFECRVKIEHLTSDLKVRTRFIQFHTSLRDDVVEENQKSIEAI